MSSASSTHAALWKVASWNVNGLRAVLRKKTLHDFLQAHAPDIVCLTETKLSGPAESIDQALALDDTLLSEYPHRAYNVSVRPGYSGTAIWSKHPPLRVIRNLSSSVLDSSSLGDLDREGRVLAAEFATFFVICVYTPNAGHALQRHEIRTVTWDPLFREFVTTLQKCKPVIVMGDLNCAHKDHDIHNPARNSQTAGFTRDERDNFETLLQSAQLVDSYRAQNPDARDCYTYWSYRQRARAPNRGWRIDYGLISKSLQPYLKYAEIHSEQHGSDHCPISIQLQPPENAIVRMDT